MYVPQLDRTKGGLAGDIIIANQRACHGLGGVQARVLLLTTQQTRHNHISHTRHDHNAPTTLSSCFALEWTLPLVSLCSGCFGKLEIFRNDALFIQDIARKQCETSHCFIHVMLLHAIVCMMNFAHRKWMKENTTIEFGLFNLQSTVLGTVLTDTAEMSESSKFARPKYFKFT